NWFSDMVAGNPATTQGDITRDKAKLAFDTGQNDSTLTVYSVPSFPTAFPDGESDPSQRPRPCYRYSDAPGGRFSQPTFAPSAAAGKGWRTGAARGARKATRAVKRAGSVTLALRVKGRARKVRVAVTFKPASGTALRTAVTASVRR